ncbi:acyl carrier protein, partial [Burkholderia pseudomallei]
AAAFAPATKASLEAALRDRLASALFVGVDEIDPSRPFCELGLDSIVGVEWIRDVNRRYGGSIRTTDVYDYPSVGVF